MQTPPKHNPTVKTPSFIPRPLRRLIWDIETAPNQGFFWRAGHKQFVNYDSITQERKIICIGYKWHGEKDVRVLSWDRQQDDRAMLQKFLRVANSADELVAHNGDKFDLPWFRTRCAFHGLSTFPRYKTVDTLQWARRQFYFNSNRLDYLARYLGFGHKIETKLELWKQVVLQNDRKALRNMEAYCVHDVDLLERVYNRLAEHCSPKSHVGVLGGKEKWSCPHCGSVRVRRNRTTVTTAGTLQHQMRCGRPEGGPNDHTNFGCGRTYIVNDAQYRKFVNRRA